MTIEVATYIAGLDDQLPDSDDFLIEGDNHVRLQKAVLKATFPNANGAINPTPAEFNRLVGITTPLISQATLQSPPVDIGSGTPRAGTFTTLTATTLAATNGSVGGNAIVTAARSVIAGNGLAGGGVLAADVTLNVGAGEGIFVAADTVGLSVGHVRNVDHSAVSVLAGAGLVGGGTINADRTLDVGAGAGISVNANDVALDAAHVRNVDHSAVQVIAGNGLTGGGAINANRTLNVGAGDGISVDANAVSLNVANNRNIDHGAVSINAGEGLSGGGNIASSRTLSLSLQSLTALTGVEQGDLFPFRDISGSVHRTITWANLQRLSTTRRVASATLSTSDLFTDQYSDTSSNIILTLPSAGSAGEGAWIIFSCRLTGNITINGASVVRGGSNVITEQGGLAVAIVEDGVWVLDGTLG